MLKQLKEREEEKAVSFVWFIFIVI